MVLSQSPDAVNLYPQADRLCLESDRLDDEGRAFLALALHFSKLLPEEKQRLLREVDTLPLERPFDPENLGSASRAAAVRMYASATIEGASWSRAQRDTARGKLQSLLRSSKNLSTQESFWVLLALNAVQQADVLSMPGERTLTPSPEFVSDNKVSVAWLQKPFGEFQQLFSGSLDPGPKNFFLVRAAFRSPLPEAREDRGLRLERVVRNLTKPERDGSASSPLKIGDEVLITYRLLSDANHYYVAVEDELAGAFEVVNPNLPLVARTYRLPENTDGDEAQLSHSEHRDQKTMLYFNQIGAGKSTYAVLARVVGAGRFRWPGAQVTPMYDSRYSAVSEATMLHAVSR